MGINLGDLTSEATSAPLGANSTQVTSAPAPAVAPTPVAPEPTPIQVPGGVSLNLSKNTVLDLTKRNPGLTKVVLAAGWDVAQTGADFDLDISAFMLKNNGKISSGNDVVFFNNMQQPGIKLNGDNRTGAGEGDDETIDIDLALVPHDVHRIAFCVSIADAVNRRQTFGMVNNSYVRLLDAANNNKEICRFVLKDNYATDTSVIFAELIRKGNEWDFKALGEGKQGDLNAIAAYYS